MAFAPFPVAAYLSDGARTEGEMKTAFENWLLATKQTSGHGQCRLLRSSATTLYLTPWGGRRVLVNDRAYEVPAAGLSVTNATLGANLPYFATLYDDGTGVVTLRLFPVNAATPRTVDPDSGVSMLSFDSGATIARNITVVGMVVTDTASQFTDLGTCSLFNPRLKTEAVALSGDTAASSATSTAVLGAVIACFANDNIACHGTLNILSAAGSAAIVRAEGKQATTLKAQATATIPANSSASLAIAWPLVAAVDSSIYGELAIAVTFGAPVTMKVGTQLLVTHLG